MRVTLEKVPILAGLEEGAMSLLLERAQLSKPLAGDVIIKEGEASNRFFVIAEGQVRICRNFATADEVEFGRLGKGEFFGEMCILETLPRSATVQATQDSLLCSVSSMAFYHLYQEMPAQHSILILNIARDLSRRLRTLDTAFAVRH